MKATRAFRDIPHADECQRFIEKLIKDGIPDAEVTIRDLAGDGDHYAATVLARELWREDRASSSTSLSTTL